MSNKDYIMRMIEEFFKILRNIIMKREQADYEMAREGLDNLSKMITGLSTEQLISLGPDGIKYFFNLDKAEDIEKIFCTAKILKEGALIDEAEGKIEDSRKAYGYALEFFEMIKDKDFNEQQEVKEEIIQINHKLSSPAT
jgi:hypothetical protein